MLPIFSSYRYSQYNIYSIVFKQLGQEKNNILLKERMQVWVLLCTCCVTHKNSLHAKVRVIISNLGL